MHQTKWIACIGCCLALLAGILWNRSLSFVRGAEENPHQLWMAALKGFEGPVYYVGDDADHSYFRAGKYLFSRYKVKTSKTHLPQMFPLGEGEPYIISHDMVRPY
jgi:hypothetical protein